MFQKFVKTKAYINKQDFLVIYQRMNLRNDYLKNGIKIKEANKENKHCVKII